MSAYLAVDIGPKYVEMQIKADQMVLWMAYELDWIGLL